VTPRSGKRGQPLCRFAPRAVLMRASQESDQRRCRESHRWVDQPRSSSLLVKKTHQESIQNLFTGIRSDLLMCVHRSVIPGITTCEGDPIIRRGLNRPYHQTSL